jgi:hypothetical protein
MDGKDLKLEAGIQLKPFKSESESVMCVVSNMQIMSFAVFCVECRVFW